MHLSLSSDPGCYTDSVITATAIFSPLTAISRSRPASSIPKCKNTVTICFSSLVRHNKSPRCHEFRYRYLAVVTADPLLSGIL